EMPKAETTNFPVSAFFGVVKPSGPTSMAVINDIKILVARSKLFVEASKVAKGKGKKVNPRARGEVKIG
ncbi:unnamed protein product, partial [Mycena citricolor]